MFKLIKKIKDDIRFNKKGITEKAFNAEVARVKEQNKRLMLAKLAVIVRETTLRETGLLQSDAYCDDAAKILLKFYKQSGAVDELYCLIEPEAKRF